MARKPENRCRGGFHHHPSSRHTKALSDLLSRHTADVVVASPAGNDCKCPTCNDSGTSPRRQQLTARTVGQKTACRSQSRWNKRRPRSKGGLLLVSNRSRRARHSSIGDVSGTDTALPNDCNLVLSGSGDLRKLSEWWRRRELNPRPRAVKPGYYMLISPLVLVHVLPGERGVNVDQPLSFRRLRRGGSRTLSSP